MPVSAPNVTPLLGVLIVLLVAYVGSLPPQKTLDVRLPVEARLEPRLGPGGGYCDNDIVLEYRSDGRLSLNKQDVDRSRLGETLKGIFDGRTCKYIFVAATPGVPYGAVAEIVDVVKGAGVREVIMLSERQFEPIDQPR